MKLLRVSGFKTMHISTERIPEGKAAITYPGGVDRTLFRHLQDRALIQSSTKTGDTGRFPDLDYEGLRNTPPEEVKIFPGNTYLTDNVLVHSPAERILAALCPWRLTNIYGKYATSLSALSAIKNGDIEAFNLAKAELDEAGTPLNLSGTRLTRRFGWKTATGIGLGLPVISGILLASLRDSSLATFCIDMGLCALPSLGIYKITTPNLSGIDLVGVDITDSNILDFVKRQS